MSLDDRPLVGRLAPSPTGAQHLGNARTYLLAWLSIRSRGGRIVLRIEDIDSPRVKPWATEQAIDDLQWLGLDWDEGPGRPGSHSPYVQTERAAIYDDHFEQLKSANMIYPCTCSRSDIAAAASAPHAEHETPVYPGTCAHRTPDDAANLNDAPFAWRYRARDELLSFTDAVVGEQQVHVQERVGDFVIFKRGSPSYQLAVVIDDHAMDVTEVLRGDDLVSSTFRQLSLYRYFGWQSPAFAHVPLVVGTDGRRLAKRHGDTRISTLREAGIPAERLIGFLAHRSGLIDHDEPVAARDLISNFDLAAVPTAELIVDAADYRRLQTGD